ncbi:MAG: pilus assembly FimT family protein [Gammaproteobacteria bacterium]
MAAPHVSTGRFAVNSISTIEETRCIASLQALHHSSASHSLLCTPYVPAGNCFPSAYGRRLSGYTLFELLVVILLMSLVGSIIFPQLDSMLERTRSSFDKETVINQIAGLGYLAYAKREKILLSDYPNTEQRLPIDLPEGWKLSADPPIVYFASGICSGGSLIASNSEKRLRLTLDAPFCRPVVVLEERYQDIVSSND